MKPIIIVLLLSVYFLSCKSNLKEAQNMPFEGNWVLKEVIENTQTYQSISKAKELSDFYASELVFDKSGDSVSVYNGQEGYVRLPINKTEEQYSFQIRGTKASPILFNSTDSTLFFADSTLNRVYRFSKADITYLDTTFEESVAFPGYINNAMIEGKWLGGPEEVVTFSRFGEISNWDEYKSFEIVVNGEYGSNIDGDLIILRTSDKVQLFGFKRSQDSVRFYDLISLGANKGFKNGKLLHEFTL